MKTLENLVREGTRWISQAAFDAEAVEYVDGSPHLVDGEGMRLSVRNGRAGFRAACAETWPEPRIHHCWFQESATVLDKLLFADFVAAPWPNVHTTNSTESIFAAVRFRRRRAKSAKPRRATVASTDYVPLRQEVL